MHFQTVLKNKTRAIRQLLAGMSRGGAVDIDAREVEPTANCMVVVLTYWLSFEYVRDPRNALEPDNAQQALLRGAQHVLNLLAPYLEKSQRQHLLRLFGHVGVQCRQFGQIGGGEQREHADHAEDGKQHGVFRLVSAYRFLGNRWAQIDPLKRAERPNIAELEPSFYGFTEADLACPPDLPFDEHALRGIVATHLCEMADAMESFSEEDRRLTLLAVSAKLVLENLVLHVQLLRRHGLPLNEQTEALLSRLRSGDAPG